MKINDKKILLQINSVVNTGSTGRIAEDIGTVAIERGWTSYIAYGRKKRTSLSNLIKIGNKFDILWSLLQTRILDKHDFGSKKATRNLIRKIKEIEPNIIHLHNIHGYYLNIKILFKFLAESKIPIVWTFHDCWAFTGHCAYFDFIKCTKWKTECNLCPQKGNYPSSICLDGSRRNYIMKKELFNLPADLSLVPVSDWLASLMEKSFLKNHPLIRIHNGVDMNKFFPYERSQINLDKFNISENDFILLGVASLWDKRKGLSDFIKLENLINKDIKIVLVGLTEKQEKSLPSSIIGITHTESIDELAQLYSLADLYLNLTYEDNFPTTNIEALACGTPVVTYNTGGSVEAVSMETGFIVEQGNLTEILNVINIVQEKKKSFYSKACRERAIKYFDKQKKFEEYIQLYDKLIETSNNK